MKIALILLEPKVITGSLCQQDRARPACTYMQSDRALHYWLTNFQVFILDTPKNDIRQFQKWEADYSISKMQQIRSYYIIRKGEIFCVHVYIVHVVIFSV